MISGSMQYSVANSCSTKAEEAASSSMFGNRYSGHATNARRGVPGKVHRRCYNSCSHSLPLQLRLPPCWAAGRYTRCKGARAAGTRHTATGEKQARAGVGTLLNQRWRRTSTTGRPRLMAEPASVCCPAESSSRQQSVPAPVCRPPGTCHTAPQSASGGWTARRETKNRAHN
jgi:hypothetical protein